jgi:glycosyltransferase involved in cell wall biosynthesis
MKILYLSFNNPYLWTGVYRKEIEFCRAMNGACKKRNIEFEGIDIFTYQPSGLKYLSGHDVDCFKVKQVDNRVHNIFAKVRFVRGFFRTRPIFQAAYEKIKESKPDIIIYRYDAAYVSLAFNPKKIKPDIGFISEHQGKEIEELHLTFPGWVRLPVEKLKAKGFFKNIDAVIGVTSEIAEYEVKRTGRDIPYFVLTNGIDVKNYQSKKYREFKGDALKMVFVGSTTTRWHGLDRLIKGMKGYKGDINLELHIVGSIAQDVRNLVKSLNLENSIIFHGFKHGKELDEVFDNAHIAIGTLALHRENLKYGSTLKVREYTARGIPFVISYRDEDIEGQFPLCLELLPDDRVINMDEVIKFAKTAYERYGKTIPTMMRDYALKKMDYEVKVERLLDFCLSINKF